MKSNGLIDLQIVWKSVYRIDIKNNYGWVSAAIMVIFKLGDLAECGWIG